MGLHSRHEGGVFVPAFTHDLLLQRLAHVKIHSRIFTFTFSFSISFTFFHSCFQYSFSLPALIRSWSSISSCITCSRSLCTTVLSLVIGEKEKSGSPQSCRSPHSSISPSITISPILSPCTHDVTPKPSPSAPRLPPMSPRYDFLLSHVRISWTLSNQIAE